MCVAVEKRLDRVGRADDAPSNGIVSSNDNRMVCGGVGRI